MEHDGGKRLKPKGALSALKQYKYVFLTAALGIFLLLLPPGEGKTADTGRAPTAAEHFDRAALQTEMEDILSSLDGVGRLSLMLDGERGAVPLVGNGRARQRVRRRGRGHAQPLSALSRRPRRLRGR